MKFPIIVFDFGDTLVFKNNAGTFQLYDWIPDLIKKLFLSGYRLGIISNTFRYQDSHWVRNCLAKASILEYFECIIASSNYSMHKPDIRIFKKFLDFMQVNPEKCLMVGDSVRCDGHCQMLNMSYFESKSNTNWHNDFLEKIEEDFSVKRKLTNIFDYNLKDNIVTVKLRHLSEPLFLGDKFMLNEEEYEVVETNLEVTKKQIIEANEEFIKIKVKKDRYITL